MIVGGRVHQKRNRPRVASGQSSFSPSLTSSDLPDELDTAAATKPGVGSPRVQQGDLEDWVTWKQAGDDFPKTRLFI